MRIGHLGRNRGYNDQLLGSRFLRLDLFQMVNLSITEAVCYRSNQEECWFSLLAKGQQYKHFMRGRTLTEDTKSPFAPRYCSRMSVTVSAQSNW